MGRDARLLNFPRALSLKKSGVSMHGGDHLRLTGFVPPAAEAQRTLCICSTEWKKSLPFCLLKLQILHSTHVSQITVWRFLVLSCILHFKRQIQNVAEETLPANHTEPTVHWVFTWMHPTCLIQCATSSSCTAVSSTIHIQQLDFLVELHCCMGTDAAGF